MLQKTPICNVRLQLRHYSSSSGSTQHYGWDKISIRQCIIVLCVIFINRLKALWIDLPSSQCRCFMAPRRLCVFLKFVVVFPTIFFNVLAFLQSFFASLFSLFTFRIPAPSLQRFLSIYLYIHSKYVSWYYWYREIQGFYINEWMNECLSQSTEGFYVQHVVGRTSWTLDCEEGLRAETSPK